MAKRTVRDLDVSGKKSWSASTSTSRKRLMEASPTIAGSKVRFPRFMKSWIEAEA